MTNPWKELTCRQITLEEAKNLLVDERGLVNLDLLDPDVNRRFRNDFPHSYDLLCVIPLLLWQNCYYLGTTTELSKEDIRQLAMRSRTNIEPDIEVIPIADKSYRDWYELQELANTNTNSNEIFNKKEDEIEDIKNQNTTEQLYSIILLALRKRASDIHLEPTEKGLKIRYRIDGRMMPIVKPSQKIDRRLIMALKVMSNMDIAESRCPQDGRIQRYFASEEDAEVRLDMRVSTLPSMHGEKAVIRLLPQRNPFDSVDNLGFTKSALGIYKKWLKEPQGMIIITGPTGSGKTSTLYTSLQAVSKEFVNVVTIEDPVEYVLPDITQSQVNDDMNFAAGLRSILRQDPDIIMVGEIRDEETAETAVGAALTGHLVFTTLHTNDSISAIPRLISLGLDSSLISDALLGITAQRLVRKVCSHCAQFYEPTAEDLEYLGVGREQIQPQKWRKAKGCPKCSNSGYSGRTAIIELINVDSELKQLIRQGTITQMQRYLKKINFDSFRKAGMEKVMAGVTTVEELKRVLSDSVMHPQVSGE
ncbi:MAG TPA: type II/IV secretion system protein [Cyanobacteria bacterium UBA8803]|nr:type II/IV secretion system protein [Cyanobacteria bacterium UBA9273]HBL62243.1 type II/IV secretion system protein [Cyanobacteria bacterium UBA8803]